MLAWQHVRGARRLNQLSASLAFKAINTAPLRLLAGRRYQRDVRQYRTRLPTLDPTDAAIIDGLNRDGVYVTSLEALGLSGSDEMMAEATRLAASFSTDAHRRSDEGDLFTAVPPAAAATPRVFTWGLQDRLLNVVEGYLGLPAAYDGLNIIYTVADGREVATRQWHRDREDRRMVKVAIYLNDVAVDGGPFELFKIADQRQNDALGYRYVEADDAHFRSMYGSSYTDHVASCTGPRGTVVFADTARFFHRGAPATGYDRAAVFFSYFARAPRHPFFCERSGLSRRELEALAAPLPERQRDAVLWRRFLPLPLRMIPPAPL